jgi:hypothetical protein
MIVQVITAQICKNGNVEIHQFDSALIEPDAAALHHTCSCPSVSHSAHNLLDLQASHHCKLLWPPQTPTLALLAATHA